MFIMKDAISNKNFRGFTIPELIVTMSIFVTLLILVTINVVNTKQRVSLNTTINIFISDVQNQQMKAMVGDSGGRTTVEDYGIHLNSNSYALFHGSAYNPLSLDNFTISLGDNTEILSGSELIFSRMSGELVNGAATIILKENTTNEQKTIIINKYGVVTAIN